VNVFARVAQQKAQFHRKSPVLALADQTDAACDVVISAVFTQALKFA